MSRPTRRRRPLPVAARARKGRNAHAARDRAAARRTRAGWWYVLGAFAAVLALIIAIVLAQEPTFDRLGPFLGSLTALQRAAVGLAVGAGLAAPLGLLLVRRLPARLRGWVAALDAVPFTYLLVVWLPPRRSGSGASGYESHLFRSRADVYIPASILGFLLVAALVLTLALRREPGPDRTSGPR